MRENLKSTQEPEPAQKLDSESHVRRNPHGDFNAVEASRPPYNSFSKPGFGFQQASRTDWKLGDGANDGGESLSKKSVEIDPYEKGRPVVSNYKLLISGIIPRPVGFVSTMGKTEDGKQTTNLAPFSYTGLINHDPPLLTIGFAGGFDKAKDTLRNLRETEECTVNIISEHMLEAANSCSINAPYPASEWTLSGLTPAPSSVVKPARVKESVFSIEGKVVDFKEFESKNPETPGKKTGVLVIVEGVRLWVREDAINEERNLIDPAILRPVSRLGGITYGLLREGVEIPRPDWEEQRKQGNVDHLLGNKGDAGRPKV
ncbi:MAG: hypothetical protein M1828_001269 [Chrysothrix sp. TS-e1954]|nr:MAG: hypothetical protein M1828_001269 [Chrysothrix sp. TS-e1954]